MKKMYLFFAMLLTAAMLFTACNPRQTPSAKDSLIIASTDEASCLDPQFNDSIQSQNITANIFESLTREKDGKIVPECADSWDVSKDGMAYTFYLVPNVKFHNGETLTANDVKFTYERIKDSPFAAELVECVDSVSVLDEHTVEIKLLYPYGAFLALTACPQLGIVSEKAVTEMGDEKFAQNPVGSGPYKFVKWFSGDKIVLEAFPDYHMGEAPIKNVTFKIIADTNAALFALENGEIDILMNPAAIDKQTIIDNPNLTFYEAPTLRSECLRFNTEKAPFNNPEVRQAIAMTIDRQDILSAAHEGSGTIAQNVIAPNAFGFAADIHCYEKNIEKAKALMAKAGYENGFDCTMLTTVGPYAKASQVVQAQLRQLNINVKIETLEISAMYARVAKGDFQMFIVGWSYLAPDADQGVYAVYHSSQIGAFNDNRYNNPELDAALELGRRSGNPEERISAYHDVTEIIEREVPSITLYWINLTLAANKNIKGITLPSAPFYHVFDYSW